MRHDGAGSFALCLADFVMESHSFQQESTLVDWYDACGKVHGKVASRESQSEAACVVA